MREKVTRHIESTIELSKMETGNMVRILELLQMRFLELLVAKLDEVEKEIYMKALFDIRSGDISGTRFEEAEGVVMNIVERFGKLILIGDQLTVNNFVYQY